MELFNRIRRTFLARATQMGASFLSSHSLHKFRAPLLLACALTLGFMANAQSSRNALHQWEQHNPPSEKIWSRTLQALGFQIISDTKIQNHIFKLLPPPLEEPSQILLSQDKSWLVLLPHLVFSKPGAAVPSQPLSPVAYARTLSWKTFTQLIPELEKTILVRPSVKNISSPADPREIRY